MDNEQNFTPGPWHLELIGSWPFGFSITAREKEIMSQSAYCHASVQKTRRDCEIGKGFPDAKVVSRAIAEQDANARLIAAAPELYAQLDAMQRKMNCVCKYLPMTGEELPCETCRIRALLAKVSVPRATAAR